jgi:hypothetical protein
VSRWAGAGRVDGGRLIEIRHFFAERHFSTCSHFLVTVHISHFTFHISHFTFHFGYKKSV